MMLRTNWIRVSVRPDVVARAALLTLAIGFVLFAFGLAEAGLAMWRAA